MQARNSPQFLLKRIRANTGIEHVDPKRNASYSYHSLVRDRVSQLTTSALLKLMGCLWQTKILVS